MGWKWLPLACQLQNNLSNVLSFFLNMHVAHDTDGAKKCMKHTTFNTWNSWNC